MTHKLKTLGLALVAVFAMSAIAASAAQAAEEFHIDHPENGNKAILTGEVVTGGPATVSEPHVFIPKPGGIAVKCKMAFVKGTEANLKDNGTSLTSPTATVTPEYEDCEAENIGKATVSTKGCHFKFYAETTRETEAGVKQGRTEVLCETTIIEGKEVKDAIEISAAGCVIKIGTQAPGGGVNYVNTNPGTTNEKDIDAEAHVTGIEFETNGAFACTLAGIPKSGKEGTYRGNMTVKGWTDNNPEASAGKTGVYEEGSQPLGIWKE